MEMPDDTFLVAYADDVAAVITARDAEEAQRMLNQVMRRVRNWMDENRMRFIVDGLFPRHPLRDREEYPGPLEDVPIFSEDELSLAASSLRNKKAPGPDGIPSEVLRVVARSCSQVLLNMYNRCLKDGVFPKRWKIQRLVLVGKGKGDPNSPSAYRPLCMLDTAGKLLERLLRPRLVAAIRDAGDLSARQYGFRTARSTIGAIQEILNAVQVAQRGNHFSRRMVLLATLDVRNAFNSARRTDLLAALEDVFQAPDYLLRKIRSYLRDRELRYDLSLIHI